MEKQHISVPEAARQLQMTAQTVHTWIKSGRILAQKLPNGRYTVLASEIERLSGNSGAYNDRSA
jgi:predicted site-specific integrase-resolvase